MTQEIRKAPPAGSLVSPLPDTTFYPTTFAQVIDQLADALDLGAVEIHVQNIHSGWWHDLKTGAPLQRNVGELLCLIHSEISEAMEGHRKGLQDDKLPHRPMIEVELADALIRILDLAGAMQLDLGGAVLEKIKFNMSREDHKRETRLAEGGKAF